MLAVSAACAQTGAAASPVAERPAAASLVSGIAARLAHAGAIRAGFIQTQTLAAMRQPLVSKGSLVFDRAAGVIWQTDAPYKATYVITDAGVREVDANGQLVRADAGGRGVAQVSRMMRGMLGGDLSSLYAQFDVEANGTPDRWRMLLRPNQPQIAQAIRELRMSGGAYLETLVIAFANGNVTKLEFVNSARVDTLAPAERAWLGAR
ncbi:outer membrane lipoprotein carrier protein LolA [Burkholderia guangdongensis]|uniref:outer membrane lipoprotein carrier protein LolA n=1 Tax=Burkholderia guangdongensis TaxID=1792500 RepID=UPI001FE68236|nr:outer membrane lipoprotein carrier protein LolA [Burkholderia guangdongensis]